jgi:hypothetical protein
MRPLRQTPGPRSGGWLLAVASFGISSALLPVAKGQSDLLPDLIVVEQDLLDHDLVTDGNRVLLRFSTATANVGPGPVHLVGILPPLPSGNQRVNQRIFLSGGGFRDREAGQFEFHPTHNHVHVEDWTIYRLREHLEGGEVGEIVVEGEKTSFCLMDSKVHLPELPAAPSAPVYKTCGGTVQGISAGWADLYHKRLYGQNLDVKGLPHGTYWLEVEVDPERRILEEDEDNNIARIPVEIGEPTFITGPLELPPSIGPNEPGKVDLRIGARPDPKTHRGDNLYWPREQNLRLVARGARRFSVHVSVENEARRDHRFVAWVRSALRSSWRLRHFDTTGSARRNITSALVLGRHAIPLEPWRVATLHSRGVAPARKARRTNERLVYRVADGPLVDQVVAEIRK